MKSPHYPWPDLPEIPEYVPNDPPELDDNGEQSGWGSQPLGREVPRFREYRRRRIEVFHECADLDLAVWMMGFEQLKTLKRAMNRGLSSVQDTPYGGVAHHQVDVHLFEAGGNAYRGRLCYFGECPKPGKQECAVPQCGAQPFLRQFAQYRFQPERFESEPKVVLYDGG